MNSTLVASVLIAVVLAGGCDVSQKYPDKTLFAIETGEPPDAAKEASKHTLRISDVTIIQPYGGQAFVYRTGPNEYQIDYYNSFVTSPENLLTGHLIAWLANARQFVVVFGGRSSADYRWLLESNVTELYGDFVDRANPHAVLAAKFFLLDDRPPGADVLWQKSYRRRLPLPGATPEQLAAGWGKAYREILVDLASDLGNVEFPDP